MDALRAHAALALTAVLLTACGSGGDHPTVEAGLRHYLSGIDPQGCLGSGFCGQGAFPVGAGAPRVKEHSCKKLHSGQAPPTFSGSSCFVTFGRTALPVAVAVKENGEVSWAAPISMQPLPPAKVYEGGP